MILHYMGIPYFILLFMATSVMSVAKTNTAAMNILGCASWAPYFGYGNESLI